MPLQSCWLVFGCLTSAGVIPKGSLRALNADKELRALSAHTQRWGLPKPAQQGCALFSCQVFLGKEQSWVLYIIPYGRHREGKHWACFPDRGDLAAVWVLWVPEHSCSVLQPASPSSGSWGHGIPTSRNLPSQPLDLNQGFLPSHFSSTTICDPFTAERKPKVLCQHLPGTSRKKCPYLVS